MCIVKSNVGAVGNAYGTEWYSRGAGNWEAGDLDLVLSWLAV